MWLAAATLSGFAMALAAPLVLRALPRASRWILPLVPASLFASFLGQIGRIERGEEVRFSVQWVTGLGITLSLRLDGLSLLLALVITGVGALVILYAFDYLHGDPHLGRFQAFVLAFMASMLGLVLANDVISLYVFWELTSVSSFFLIGFRHERAEARGAALQALLVTTLGGLSLLAGLLLLANAAGTFELAGLLGAGERLAASPLAPAAVVLVLLGAFTKSAQLPFSWWLPRAMEAPTPASTYLHAATMVKAGVYLLARLAPALSASWPWRPALLWVGGATFLVGALRAFRETHLKRVLAQSTVSALGLLVFLIGLGTGTAAVAVCAYLLAHALYKGTLFLVAGAIDHQIGVAEIDRLGGLRRWMPASTVAAGLAALSMAGLPPALGFSGKEAALESAGHTSAASTVALVLGSALTLAIALRVGLLPFLGRPPPGLTAHGEAPPAMWAPPLALAVLGVVFGLWPDLPSPLLSRAAAAITEAPVEAHLVRLPEPGPLLGLTAVTVGAGIVAYLARRLLARIPAGLEEARGYALALRALDRGARFQTRLLQSGYIRVYVLIVLVSAAGLAGQALLARPPHLVTPLGDVRIHELAIAVLITLSALAAVRSPSRLGAVVFMGAAGYGVGLVFLLFGAPDLAMTQFVVETLTVIVFVLAFYHLPRFTALSRPVVRLRDAALSLAVGGLVAMLILAANATQAGDKISDFFLQASYPEAHGRNVVNVILVDFRALDTLGEITVLATAGTAVFALLKLRLDTGRGP